MMSRWRLLPPVSIFIRPKLGSFQILKDRPSPTELRRTLALLKRYQILEVLDSVEEAQAETRMIIYPSINMALMGENARKILESFTEEEQNARKEV